MYRSVSQQSEHQHNVRHRLLEMRIFLWSSCDRLTIEGFYQKQGQKYEQINVFTLRVTTNLTTLCVHVSSTTCFGRLGRHKVDFAKYLEKNRPIEMKVSPPQVIFLQLLRSWLDARHLS